MNTHDRRSFLRLTGAAAGAAALSSACSGSSLGGGGGAAKGGPVRLGVLLPETGVYKSLGTDARNGFNLYLELHGGKLGGREVKLHTADEGDKQEVAQAGAEKLIKRDKVLAAVGTISSRAMLPAFPMFADAKIPLIGVNSSPPQIQGKKYGWRTSFHNDDAGLALGEYVAKELGEDAIFLMGADYQAGHDYVNAFMRTFEPAGGKTAAEPQYTPFPLKGSFQSFLTKIQQSAAKAVYCFYAGGDAVKFVKEYKQFGLTGKYPLYAPGYLTEGSALEAQGEAALGILTSQNYASNLDNAQNRTFVSAYQKKHGLLPSTYAMCAYDAGWILDKAIEACGDEVTSERIEEKIGNLGQIESPRGPWRFGANRSPVQKWYLREVRRDGGVLSNIVIDELTTLGEAS